MPFHFGRYLGDLLALGRVARCGRRGAEFQEIERASGLRVELLVVIRSACCTISLCHSAYFSLAADGDDRRVVR